MTHIRTRSRPITAVRAMGTAALIAGAALMWSGLPAHAAPAPESFAPLAKKVTPAVVNISAVQKPEVAQNDGPQQPFPFQFPPGSPFEEFFKQFQDRMGQGQGPQGPNHEQRVALGSGFIIDAEGYVVTNNHVIDGASEVSVRLDDDESFPAKIIGTDPKTDLALLKIEANRSFPYVKLGDSDRAEVGSWVMAVGNPFGLGGTVTAGIVSARGRNIDAGPYDDFLQIDASINKGNSGGPLFNTDGEVIGINSAIYSPNGGSVGIGFAIPSNLAKPVLAALRDHGSVERGWLGVQIQPVTQDIAHALGLSEAKGAIVAEITANSPAEQSGLKKGDVILELNGRPIADSRALARMVASLGADQKAELGVWRDGSQTTLGFTTGKLPTDNQVASAAGDTMPGSLESKDLGAELAALTPQTRARFGIDESTAGVLVVDVQKPDPRGLLPGDVIKQIGQEKITGPRDLEQAVARAKDGGNKAVLLLVSRQGNDLFIGVKLGVA